MAYKLHNFDWTGEIQALKEGLKTNTDRLIQLSLYAGYQVLQHGNAAMLGQLYDVLGGAKWAKLMRRDALKKWSTDNLPVMIEGKGDEQKFVIDKKERKALYLNDDGTVIEERVLEMMEVLEKETYWDANPEKPIEEFDLEMLRKAQYSLLKRFENTEKKKAKNDIASTKLRELHSVIDLFFGNADAPAKNNAPAQEGEGQRESA